LEKTATRYKVVKSIKDEKFSIDSLHQYVLLLQLGIHDLQMAVVDVQDNKCLVLEDIILADIKSNDQWLAVLTEIFENHQFIRAGFWKSVKISFKNSKFTQVPQSLFIPEAARDYLAINCAPEPGESIHYYRAIKSEAVTIFSCPEKICAWLKGLYPNSNVGFVHQSASLIEGTLNYAKLHKNNKIYLYIDRFKLHITTVKNNNIEYYNQFQIKQFSEYIKYIMLVMSGLQYNQKTSHVVIWGYIGKQSPHYKEFYKYIKDISFGDRPEFLKFGYVFDEIQDHHYFDLFSIYLCD